MRHRLRDNPLVHPPFADRPPFGLTVSAQGLGLILSVLGVIAVLVSLLFATRVSGLCNDLPICSFPTVDLAGTAIQTGGWLVATLGFAGMLALRPDGKLWATYGVTLALLGALLSLLGDAVFVGANSLYYALGWGAISFAVFWLAVCSLFYYLVVISRFPGAPSTLPGHPAPLPQPSPSSPDPSPPGA